MDEGNGFYYVRARYYMPETGRFLTKDMLTGKVGDPQTLNRYVYALNNPIRLIDISGFSAREGGVIAYRSSSDIYHNGLINGLGYSLEDQFIDLLRTTEHLGGDFIKLAGAQSAFLKNYSKASQFISLFMNTGNELGGLRNILTFAKNLSSNIRSATADDWIETAKDTATSMTAVSVNTLVDIATSPLRQITGGKDLSITGSDVEKAINTTTDWLGGKFYQWGLY